MTAAEFRAWLSAPQTAGQLDAMLTDNARTDARTMSPISLLLPITCYVEHDRINHGRKSIALCGEWVAERDISNTPTCPECRRLLARTPDQMFGATPPGRPVPFVAFDPLAGYRPRQRK